MSSVVRKWAFGHMRTAKLQASLRIRAVSPEALLFVFTQTVGLKETLSKEQSFLRVCADAQARLKLCCLHMSEGPFSHDAAHLV